MSLRRYTVSIGDRSFTIDVVETAADRFEVSVDGRVFEATLVGEHDVPGGAISPAVPEAAAALPAREPAREPAAAPASGARPPRVRALLSPDSLAAPMPGVVLEVFVGPGASLRRGDPVLVLEAMKMRNTIRCPHDAVVSEVAVVAGQPVGPGDVLVRFGSPPT